MGSSMTDAVIAAENLHVLLPPFHDVVVLIGFLSNCLLGSVCAVALVLHQVNISGQHLATERSSS